MPTYSYACTECGNSFDIVQKFSDDSLTVCADCGGRLRKLFNSVGIVFKGSGFYRNDSRSGTVQASSDANGANGSSAGDNSSGGSSESANGSASESSATGSKTGSGSSAGSDSSAGSGSSTGSKTTANSGA